MVRASLNTPVKIRGNVNNAIGWGQLASEAYGAKSLPPAFEPGLEAPSFFEPPNCGCKTEKSFIPSLSLS